MLNTARCLLSKQNFKILQSIEDKEVRMAIAKGIARIPQKLRRVGFRQAERIHKQGF